MKSYEIEMNNVLKALNKSGALSYCVISGSWAMYFYKYIFDNFIPRVETTDLDIFLPNPKKASSNGLVDELSKLKYIKNTDFVSGKTMFLSDSGFSMEFLTIPNRTMSNTINVPGLSVVAEALPKMAPAGWNIIQLKYNDMLVNVVSPVSFVLQKLLIHNERKSEYKKEKDIDAVKYVFDFINVSQIYKKELKEELEHYPKKWKRTIVQTAKNYNIELL